MWQTNWAVRCSSGISPNCSSSRRLFDSSVASGPEYRAEKHARPAAQGVDHQAAVIGQHPTAEVPCIAGGLQPGVGGKRVAVLLHLKIVGKIGQRPQFHADRPEQIRQFEPFLRLAVPRTSMEKWLVVSGQWSATSAESIRQQMIPLFRPIYPRDP